MLLLKDKTELQNIDISNQLEWLETNGLGGWAGSTLTGCNTRRYHGLLMAAVVPPAERMLLVSKLDETILCSDQTIELATNDYGNVFSPEGFQSLYSFQKELFPEWIYEAADLKLRKTIMMVQNENTTLIRYEVMEAAQSFTLQLRPLIAARFYHSLQNASSDIHWDVEFSNGIFHNRPFDGAPDIFISVPGSEYKPVNEWFYHFNYAVDKYRGQDFVEDLFNHGLFTVKMKIHDVLDIIISTENPSGRNTTDFFNNEKQRKLDLVAETSHQLTKQLTAAADQFIVKRRITELNDKRVDLKTVIAGYHWFTDWSRDTMISLSGLCLSTGRTDDAKKIISVFAKSVSMGMLPNRFQDNHEPPEYNTVDGTLWYFQAIYEYLLKTKDNVFVLGEILPVLKDIISWHYKGTRFNIHVDNDELLYAGAPGQQLTWMDAKTGDHVVTPRMGKPVEIQALWFNALKIFQSLLMLNGETGAAADIQIKSERVRKSFTDIFWFAEGGYLFDVIDEHNNADSSLRPNQLLALSLPFPLFTGPKAVSILNIVREKLYTPVGLRSLSPEDPKYQGHYGGDALKRDAAYHQGPVWSWLLGPYVDAGMKTMGEKFRPEAMAIIEHFDFHMNEACIGSVSEIFDGDLPHHPRGCVAQAWGVAEILRVIKTYSLYASS